MIFSSNEHVIFSILPPFLVPTPSILVLFPLLARLWRIIHVCFTSETFHRLCPKCLKTFSDTTNIIFQCLQEFWKHLDARLQIHENLKKFQNSEFSNFLSRQNSISQRVSFLISFPINPKPFPALSKRFGDAFWYYIHHTSMLTSYLKTLRRHLTNAFKIHENPEIFQKSEIINFFVPSKDHFPDEYDLQNYFLCLLKCSKYVL